MKFIVQPSRAALQVPDTHPPYFILKQDNWDDYGFRTLFILFYVSESEKEPLRLGPVKILNMEQKSGLTLLPSVFEELSLNRGQRPIVTNIRQYCSLTPFS